jgi:transglutaminase-like putative cysteine protease
MLISFGYDISLRLEVETAVLFCLRVHPSRREDIVSGEKFRIEPQSPFEQYLDGFGNISGRVHCKPGIVRFVNQGVIRDSGQLDAYEPSEIFNLPQETLVYLLPSRYCEVDSELANFAWANFSTTPLGWSRVQAISDFVHGHIQFDYQKARATRTALDAFRERVGRVPRLHTPRGYPLPLREYPGPLCDRARRDNAGVMPAAATMVTQPDLHDGCRRH